MQQKTKVIYSIKLANGLLIRGHKMLGVAPNIKRKGAAVFFFEYDKSIDRHITEFLEDKNNIER